MLPFEERLLAFYSAMQSDIIQDASDCTGRDLPIEYGAAGPRSIFFIIREEWTYYDSPLCRSGDLWTTTCRLRSISFFTFKVLYCSIDGTIRGFRIRRCSSSSHSKGVALTFVQTWPLMQNPILGLTPYKYDHRLSEQNHHHYFNPCTQL